MDNEPNEREMQIAREACRVLRLSEKYNAPEFAKALAIYRAELRPPGDRDAAEEDIAKATRIIDRVKDIIVDTSCPPTDQGAEVNEEINAYYYNAIAHLDLAIRPVAAALTAARKAGYNKREEEYKTEEAELERKGYVRVHESDIDGG